MRPTQEELCAYIDGELEPAQMASIAALVESSAELKQYVYNQERLLENLHAAFATMMNEPVPDHLVRTATETPVSFRSTVRNWRTRRVALRSSSVLRFAVPAAALVVGLFVGVGIERPSSSYIGPSPTSGQIVAQAALASALNEQLASQPAQSGTRIGMTFRNKSGDICRTFEVNGDATTTDGLACNRGGEWQVGTLVNSTRKAATPYELAGSSTPAAIRDAVSSEMNGLPFDAAAERKARDSGWK